MIERPESPRRGRGHLPRLLLAAALVFICVFLALRVIAPPGRGPGRGRATDRKGAATLPYPKSPYLNARPDVAYTGDGVCAPCHQDLFDSYHQHGMARSFAPVGATRVYGDWSGAGSVHHEGTNFTYRLVERDGRRFVQETRADSTGRTIHEVEKEIAYVIGSGANDQGFIYAEAGGLYIVPVEWYTERGIWDMAPGFERPDQERLTRKFLPGCIGCHASYPDYIADSGNRYREPLPPPIGCERCHGPGALHVAARVEGAADTSGGAFDSTIVNPRRLPRARQIEICAQCHMQGDARWPRQGRGDFDYRPGLPLSEFREVYLPAVEDTLIFGFVRHVERMIQSRCYVESGTMTCTTCHNAHETSRWRPASHWVARCLSCHEMEDCPRTGHGAARDAAHGALAAGDSTTDCVACHMRRSQPFDLEHVAITDHWIRRRVEPPAVLDKTLTRARQDVPLVAVSLDGAPPETTGAALQGLGMAHVAIAQYARALPLLDRGLALGPPRSEAHLQRAIAKAHLDRREEALRDLDEAARLGPESAESAFRLGQTNLEAGRARPAAAAFREGLARYGEDASAWANLAMALVGADSLDAALEAARRAVALHPASYHAQRVLGTTLVASGKFDEAEAPIREALRLSPDDPDGLLALGDIAAARGNRADAVAAWAQAARFLPRSPEPWLRIAAEEEEAGNLTAAIAARREITNRVPSEPRAWMDLGDLLGRAGRYELSIAAFRRAVTLDPKAVAAWGNMALAYVELGDPVRARGLLDTVLALDPENRKARALLDVIGREAR